MTEKSAVKLLQRLKNLDDLVSCSDDCLVLQV